jgi:signal transduction histidine kinase/CheY-like chemotaxis protein
VSDCFIETDPAHPLLLSIFRDISARVGAVAERTRLEESLRQAQKMESLGTLAGGIAHDFNNILTGMFGFLELARYDLPPQHPAQEWLRQVMDSGHRAKELVRQILTFSRNQPGARAPLQLHRIIGEAVNLLRSTLPAKVDLGARLERGCPAVLADANQIHQIVMNLCTNAWHALPERGGRIFITLEPAVVPADLVPAHPQFAGRSAVCLTVSDNGSGIPPEALPRIFEPFFTTKEVGKGTGLGLAVVHGIVGTHEGAITVQSVVGAGTTFRIFLPALATAASPAPAAIAPSVPAGQGQHILWIDDDVATNIAVERTLTALGYRVTACRHPAAAVEKFSATPREFALVLTDLSMPEMGGDELITIFRRVAPTLPMLVVTGFVQPVEREALLAHGVNEVLHKPLTREELAAAIARHVPTARA